MLHHSSIFDQEWFYHAATNGNYLVASHKGSGISCARIIFSAYRIGRNVILSMPPLARVMQPVIIFDQAEARDDLSLSIKAVQGLLEALPEHSEFRYCLPPDTNLDSAFGLAGCTVSAKYTFRAQPHSTKKVWDGMHQKVRYNIRIGLKRFSVQHHDDVSRYIDLSRGFVRNRAFNDNVDYGAILRIWQSSQERGQSTIISCVDRKGVDVASALLIWDEKFLYYWMNCRNSEARDYSANSVLLWSAIELAESKELVFDVDGFATNTAGLFFSRFGLSPHRRFEVVRSSSGIQLRNALSQRVRDLVGPGLRQNLLRARNFTVKRKL